MTHDGPDVVGYRVGVVEERLNKHSAQLDNLAVAVQDNTAKTEGIGRQLLDDKAERINRSASLRWYVGTMITLAASAQSLALYLISK